MAVASSTKPAAAGVSRVGIVAEARSWRGTPYRHQASMKGAGCDCFGLIRGVWRALYGPEPESVPPYSRDWGSVTGMETVIATGRKYLVAVDPAAIGPGDILIFRIKRRIVAKHIGIMTQPGRFIHAQENVPVSEVALSDWWRRRIVATFSFPGLVPCNPEKRALAPASQEAG